MWIIPTEVPREKTPCLSVLSGACVTTHLLCKLRAWVFALLHEHIVLFALSQVSLSQAICKSAVQQNLKSRAVDLDYAPSNDLAKPFGLVFLVCIEHAAHLGFRIQGL